MKTIISIICAAALAASLHPLGAASITTVGQVVAVEESVAIVQVDERTDPTLVRAVSHDEPVIESVTVLLDEEYPAALLEIGEETIAVDLSEPLIEVDSAAGLCQGSPDDIKDGSTVEVRVSSGQDTSHSHDEHPPQEERRNRREANKKTA